MTSEQRRLAEQHRFSVICDGESCHFSKEPAMIYVGDLLDALAEEKVHADGLAEALEDALGHLCLPGERPLKGAEDCAARARVSLAAHAQRNLKVKEER